MRAILKIPAHRTWMATRNFSRFLAVYSLLGWTGYLGAGQPSHVNVPIDSDSLFAKPGDTLEWAAPDAPPPNSVPTDTVIGTRKTANPPKFIQTVAPTYTHAMLNARVEGKVRTMVLIDTAGNVTRVKVIQHFGLGSAEAAISAARNSRFTPATQTDGKPVAVWVGVPYNFKLAQPDPLADAQDRRLRDSTLCSTRENELLKLLGVQCTAIISIAQSCAPTAFPADTCTVEVMVSNKGKLRYYGAVDTSIQLSKRVREAIDNGWRGVHFPSSDSCAADFVFAIKVTKSAERKIVEVDPNYSLRLYPGRSKASIMKVVMPNLRALREQYNIRLREQPGLKGRITVKFAIDEYGAVVSCTVTETTMHNRKLENAIVGEIKNWLFPPIRKPGDITEVVYPFVFSQ